MINKWLSDFFRIVSIRIIGLGVVNFFFASFLSTYLDDTSSGLWILAILLGFFYVLAEELVSVDFGRGYSFGIIRRLAG